MRHARYVTGFIKWEAAYISARGYDKIAWNMVKVRKSVHSLAGKLILRVGLLMTICTLLLGYSFISYQKRLLLKNLTNFASSSTQLVKRGIDYGMLTAQREAIQQNLDVLGTERNVRFIRVLNSTGQVAYASDRRELGKVPYSGDELANHLSIPITTDIQEAEKTGTLSYSVPIMNESRCFSAACHFHKPEQKVLGVLEAGFSTSDVDKVIKQNRVITLLLIGLFVFAISLSLCIILYNFVSKPVALLEAGMKRIAKGELDEPIKINTQDEMGLLAQTFNQMAQDISRYRQHMEYFTHSLEEEVKKKTEDIMKAQEELLNAEKLASLGRMAAGVAHELNSPLTGVVTFAHLLKERTHPADKQAHEDLEMIIEQATRCSKIIKGLLGFARRTGPEIAAVNMNDLVDSTVSMVINQARFHNIKFDMRLAPYLPLLTADPNQLQQVFLNLIINAADAMNDKGTITIATRVNKDNEDRDILEIEFADTGPGIPEAHMGKVFEPFFTTKPVGKGTGLGLSVSYGIIKRHGGEIIVKSQFGKGTSFSIKLPCQPVKTG